ncbi:MAG: hypothetical protein M1296_01970 [Chloroflexi bacterium]|nr:hypothetical protein [Chloroflexota bacterium]
MGGWALARDVVIFLFCVSASLVLLVGMAVLVRLSHLLLTTGDDARGILHSLHATVATTDVTASFVSALVITPVARLGGIVLGARAALRSLFKRRGSN